MGGSFGGAGAGGAFPSGTHLSHGAHHLSQSMGSTINIHPGGRMGGSDHGGDGIDVPALSVTHVPTIEGLNLFVGGGSNSDQMHGFHEPPVLSRNRSMPSLHSEMGVPPVVGLAAPSPNSSYQNTLSGVHTAIRAGNYTLRSPVASDDGLSVSDISDVDSVGDGGLDFGSYELGGGGVGGGGGGLVGHFSELSSGAGLSHELEGMALGGASSSEARGRGGFGFDVKPPAPRRTKSLNSFDLEDGGAGGLHPHSHHPHAPPLIRHSSSSAILTPGHGGISGGRGDPLNKSSPSFLTPGYSRSRRNSTSSSVSASSVSVCRVACGVWLLLVCVVVVVCLCVFVFASWFCLLLFVLWFYLLLNVFVVLSAAVCTYLFVPASRC